MSESCVTCSYKKVDTEKQLYNNDMKRRQSSVIADLNNNTDCPFVIEFIKTDYIRTVRNYILYKVRITENK